MSAPAATTPRKGIDPRWFSASLLTLILVVGQWKYQILGDDYTSWAVAFGSAIVCELVLFRLHSGGVPNLLSAYISGNSVAILLKPQGDLLWPFAVGSLVSIGSKYVLRYDGRHLWNPTNFGVCALLLLAPDKISILSHQWGNDWGILLAIWSVGLLVVTRARVWHLTVGYLLLFAALAWVRTLFNQHSFAAEVGPITGPMYTLFVFFMVTDPRTIVSGRQKQLLVLLLIGLVECAIRMAVDAEKLPGDSPLAVAPGMYALFLVGAPALWLQLRAKKKSKAAATALAPAA
jgi:enediyne biosynthesis protein E5